MSSGSHYDFINFLERNHKNLACTLVSDSVGMNHRIGLQIASHAKCTKRWNGAVLTIWRNVLLKNVIFDSEEALFQTSNTIALSLST